MFQFLKQMMVSIEKNILNNYIEYIESLLKICRIDSICVKCMFLSTSYLKNRFTITKYQILYLFY